MAALFGTQPSTCDGKAKKEKGGDSLETIHETESGALQSGDAEPGPGHDLKLSEDSTCAKAIDTSIPKG